MSADVSETLGWEAEQRPRAGAAGIASGLFILAANAAVLLVFQDYPRAPLLDVVQEAVTGERTLKAEQVAFVKDHAFGILLADASLPPGGLLMALGFLAMAVLLHFLYRAVAARRPETANALRYVVMVGPVAAAVGALMSSIGRVVATNGFEGGDPEAARDALLPPFTQAGQLLLYVGVFITAIGIVLIALNAMRVGLLTRFMGVLGVIAGGLWVLQIDQLALVRSFWLIAVGLLVLGRTPRGAPPAWQTGRAEPWPTQQELRERRDALRAGQEPPVRAAEEEVEPVATGAPDPSPATAKRKRKRRR